MSRNKYIRVKVGKGHHLADKQGRALRSRLEMEKKIGRHLRPGEVVHHCDGDKANDAPGNLMLFTSSSEHLAYHAMIPRLSVMQQGILALLRQRGEMNAKSIRRALVLSKADVGNSLQQLKLRGCVMRSGAGWWTPCDNWAKRIVITLTGPEYHREL